ncbi:MAG: substrate-binding domain-containing protein, partial [Anaerolineae bacterium]|nr:substrate-binding domain-containing protein [Anaerolineae bacterium]
YTIGVVLKTLSNQHWQVMKRGYEETAQKYNVRVKVVAADSEGEEAQQLALTEALLAEGCDALCVSPLTGTNLTPVVEQALAAGLPVINVDDARVEGTAVTTLLSAGQVAIGQQVADYFINKLRSGDRVAMIGGKPGSQAAELRRRGFYRGLKKSELVFTHNRKIALEVKNLSTKDLLKNVNFTAHWGEIFGIAGLIGAGRTELVRAIFGADPIQSGEILVDGQSVTIKSPRDAIKLGLGLVPEDRKNQGLILGMSVLNNATLTILDRIAGWGIIQTARRRGIAEEYVAKLSVKTPSLSQQVRFLSGGNQQKVVIAKWLASQARILIFDEPTRGIDVGAKVEIRELVNELVKQGVCVIVISSELPEVLGICDRIMVMHEGRVTGVFEAVWTSEEEILHYASGLTTEFVPNQ